MENARHPLRRRMEASDLQGIVRLILDLQERQTALPAARLYLLERLCLLLQASEASMALTRIETGAEMQVLRTFSLSHVQARPLPCPLHDDPLLQELLVGQKLSGPYPLTRLQRELAFTEARRSLRARRRADGWGDVIYSVLPLPHGKAGVLRIQQGVEQNKRWSNRHAAIVDLVHSELVGLYVPSSTPALIPESDLSPRQSQTLRRLLKGMSEKQIALSMRLSVHTVHVYVKSIYRTFQVSSRGELMAKWVRR